MVTKHIQKELAEQPGFGPLLNPDTQKNIAIGFVQPEEYYNLWAKIAAPNNTPYEGGIF